MAKKGFIPKGKWGLCISHDVDHLRHYWNLNLIKYWGVSFIELVYLRRSFSSFLEAISNSFVGRFDSWDQTELLASVNRKYGIPATFFFVAKKGRGVDYGVEEIKKALQKIKGFEVGTHGQDFENIVGVKEEFGLMGKVLGKKPEGIRMHYLNWAPQTAGLIKKAGYIFDTTEFNEQLKQPYVMDNGLIEIPLHIMDTYLFSPLYTNFSLAGAKKHTLKLIAKAKHEGKILHVLFHLRHLSTEFPRYRDYYLWLLELAKNDKNCEKISCRQIARKLK